MYKLYHYVHCPYCIRVRMALGYLKLDYKSIVLSYSDEETPTKLVGKKMLPIMELPDGTILNESLDIISKIDKNNQLNTATIIKNEIDSLNEFLSQISSPAHGLILPYWAYSPEFAEPNARRYFQNKHERKRGPFHQLMQDKRKFVDQADLILEQMAKQLSPYLGGADFSLKDILVASHLWGLYIVPEFQFPTLIHRYLQSISQMCHFNYHGDFWKK